MPTTADCKKFIVAFITATPDVILSRVETQENLQETLDPKNWKREYKCKPGGGEGEFDEYIIHKAGTTCNRFGDPAHYRVADPSEFVAERRFDCDPFEGQVAFLVLEGKDGKLYFGDYVGD